MIASLQEIPMNRNLSLLIGIAGTFFFAGCTAGGHLYPIRGPLAAQSSAPVYHLKLTDGLHSGNVSVALDNGETGSAKWNLVPQDKSSNLPPVSQSPDMPAVWDTVYGSGFYIAHVLGN